jgi:phage FluMu gp28-like protein
MSARADDINLDGITVGYLAGTALPDVLLPLQQEVVHCADICTLLVIEKARRIGVTWALAGWSALTAGKARAAGGTNIYYMGYEKEMTREFIKVVADWARVFNLGAAEMDEVLLKGDKEEDIQAFRIRFASGFEVLALTSSARNLRGRQGVVLIDEFAFHDDPEALLQAATPLIIRGGKVIVLSTHNGEESYFNTLINDIRAERREGKVLRYDFMQAVGEGLYRQTICLPQNKPWSQALEDEWVKSIYKLMTNPDEELDVIPSQGGGVWLPLSLIEAAHSDVPVLRFKCDADFVGLPPHIREAEARDWLERDAKTILAALNPMLPHSFGYDFARKKDLSVIDVMVEQETTRKDVVLQIEMENVPFAQQEQILFYVADRLPRFKCGAIDAGGNGAYIAEAATQRYGTRALGVMFTVDWYRTHMPALKAAFEDKMIRVPRDRDTTTDLRQFRLVKGVPSLPDKRTKGEGGEMRHGDAGISIALAHFATRQMPADYGYEAAIPSSATLSGRMAMRAQDDDDIPANFMSKGAW